MGSFEGPPTGGPPTLPPFSPPPLPFPTSGQGASTIGAGTLGQIVGYVADVERWNQRYASCLFGGLSKALKSLAAPVLRFIQWLQHTWLGRIITQIYDKLKKAVLKIIAALKLAICIFQAYEALVQFYEDKIFGPIINLLQRIRRVLLVFRVLHIKWAMALDNYIVILEGRLTKIFYGYQRALNKVIDYLNIIVDPFGLFNESMYVQSAIRSAGAKLFFLPKYSPDLNPIEQFFAKLKHWLRHAAKRTPEAICNAIGLILGSVGPVECRNYFINAGYEPT